MAQSFFKKLKNWALAAPLLMALCSGGCTTDFWKTRFIEENAKKVIEKEPDLIETYRRKCKVELIQHPPRKEEPLLTINPDNTYTLFYQTEFTESAKLEGILKEQMPGVVVSKSEPTHQLIIKLKDTSSLGELEEIIQKTDRLPPQVLLEFIIYSDFGDWTQDFATKLDLDVNLTAKAGQFSTGSIDSIYPGSSVRTKEREVMGTKYGIGFNSENFKFKAILDVLESLGYVNQVYKTRILVSNHQKGSVKEEEKLPIPAYVLAGNQVIQTLSLEPISSFFEATPEIYENGIVRLTFKAGLGSAKRPEGHVQNLMPVKDEVNIDNVYLRVGQPMLVAGKANEIQLGIRRKDPLISGIFGDEFGGSVDKEKRTVRTWYEVTPYSVDYFINVPPLKIKNIKVLRTNQEILNPDSQK